MNISTVRAKKIVFIIIIISFLLKLGAGFILRSSFMSRGNSYTSLNKLAYNLVKNKEYSIEKGIPSVDYEPLYPFLMALGYFLFGYNWIGLTLLQGLLFAATAFLLFKIGCIVRNEITGLIAATVFSFYPYLFTYSISVYDTTLFNFFLYFLIFLIIRESHGKLDYFLIGIFMGLAILTRGSILVLLPAFFIVIFFQLIKLSNKKKFFISFSLLFLGISLIIAPWLLRNYKLTGRVLISTHGPFGFWQGNNKLSYKYLKNNISLDNIYRLKPEIIKNNPMKNRGPKEAIKTAEIFKKEAIKFIKENPGEFLKLAYIKFVKFWSWERNPTSSTPVYGSNNLRRFVNYIAYIPLLISLFPGLFVLHRHRKDIFSLFIMILLFYTSAHMIVMGFTRARLPLDPILMILFGLLLKNFFYKLKN